MSIVRNGSYPAPPCQVDRLTGGRIVPDIVFDLLEVDFAIHSYIQDGHPGPCVIFTIDDRFMDWSPSLTIERAERAAA
ncbi:hypothetical protein [Sphingobium sp.]|uniref:hypothetical protein n=1 Tax=Sphingobium sp. TaxID=1912891 RepID=UPI002E1DD297